MTGIRHLIVELRQYTLRPGRRDDLIALFETELIAPQEAAGTRWTLLRPDSVYSEPDSEPWENGGRGVAFPHALPADSAGAAAAFIFQWHKDSFEQVLPTGASGSVPITVTKPGWSG